METRKDLLYAHTHEWLKVEGSLATIGISDYAQQALGAIVFIELPKVDAKLAARDVLSVAESVKAASEIYTPAAGRVVRINQALADKPELVNEHPYDSWIAVLELSDPQQLTGLMDEAAYRAFCSQEHA